MKKSIEDFIVTITVPTFIPYTRGINSTYTKEGSVRVRMSTLDRQLIKEEAERLNISSSSFMRQCAVNVATELKQRRS